ncbi:branched-chain amino acid ABC transporter permease [Rhodopseudomonas palustris]|uniref:Branched-chain amino acid ABC transporter permease n=1 Tax=Rhodopseudomonas palustris TaxID=1076 RepID=A0A418V0L4_RHOPL|nr:branched-chain amino acid ABC transporter permease [Rhodopseudomonas palustris]RJF69380.1 branched-chain amino acid ABC transporter permease [Rhodopseudomonas palustris]
MLLQQVLNGVMLGGAYALIAIGYTLVFGVLHLVHLAHGEVFMVGAFIALQMVLLTGGGVAVALPVAALAGALVGVLVYLVAIKPIRSRKGHYLAPMISTIGAGLVLQEVATRVFGGEQVGFPVQMEAQVWHLGPVTLTSVQLVILTVSIGLMFALHLFVTMTRVGMAMRATAESMVISNTLGIRSDRIIILTFAIASALAGIAGVLVGMSFNSISPYMGVDMGIKGLAAMLLGGLGNVYGAMIGGLVIGLVEVVSVAYLSSSYRDAFAFIVIIAVLLLRPRGIFGSTAHVEG